MKEMAAKNLMIPQMNNIYELETIVKGLGYHQNECTKNLFDYLIENDENLELSNLEEIVTKIT